MSYRNREGRPLPKGPRRWHPKIAKTEQEPPFGPVVCELDIKDLFNKAEMLEKSSFISDCTAIASYNWLDSEEPTILVPGTQLYCLSF